MKIVAEIDGDFFDEKKKDPRRIYISFDKEGCDLLIKLLSEYYETDSRGSAKLMTEAWGIGPLSAENYYEGAVVPDILEFTMID